MLLSLEYPDPAVTTQVIRTMEAELTEVLVQLLGNCSAEEFYAIMRLVLQGLEMRNVWQQNAKVRHKLCLFSTSFFSFLYLGIFFDRMINLINVFFLIPDLCSVVRSN